MNFDSIFLKFGKLTSNYMTKLSTDARHNYAIFENFGPMLLNLIQFNSNILNKVVNKHIYPIQLKSISFKKGAKNSCVHEICRLLPRSKSSTNHNKTSPNPNLRKYTVKGFVMYIFLSNCFTWFHRNL